MLRLSSIVRFWPMSMFILVALLCLLLISWTNPDTDTFATELDLNFAAIVDAGSSGSRLFLYCWPVQNAHTTELISITPVINRKTNEPVVAKITPGLSYFVDNPTNASVYLHPLLQTVEDHVPREKHALTPVFILATAGMRLLSNTSRELLLNNLRCQLHRSFEFIIAPEQIRVIDGQWEGVYSWIAVNFMLDRFKLRDEKAPKTVGMIDMGGASVQLAVELPGRSTPATGVTVQLGDFHNYHVYAASFLGFGANEAIKKHDMRLADGQDDPCRPMDLVHAKHKGLGHWDACYKSLLTLLNISSCSLPPCVLAGVLRPPIDLSNIELFGFSEYWYSVQDVFSLGGRYDFNRFATRSRLFCRTPWSTLVEKHRSDRFTADDRLRNQCFKSAWIAAVLHDGFGLAKSTRTFTTMYKIKGQEVQWTLGTVLYNMYNFKHQSQNGITFASRFFQLDFYQLCLLISIFLFMMVVIITFLPNKILPILMKSKGRGNSF